MAPMLREFHATSANGRSGMKPIRAAHLAIAALLGWTSVIPARAAPPTATPSPGYDARLQEQRAASRAHQRETPVIKRVSPRRAKHAPNSAR
jgi:hypothetical protein